MAAPSPIVVAHASVGSGHRVAAEAVARELGNAGRASVSVEVVDALEYGSMNPSGNSLTDLFTGPAASFYDRVWASNAIGGAARSLGAPLLAVMFRRFIDYLAEKRPAVVVCTHALPAVLAAREVRRRKLNTHVVAVATDFGVHGFWPSASLDLFCVADDPSADALSVHGIDSSAIAVTGIPVRPQFGVEYEREAVRVHFDIAPEGRLILAIAGASMPGPYEHFKAGLSVALPALASLPGASVCVVTGHDEQFAEDLKSRAAGFGTTNVTVLGFVEHMAPLMNAADVALAKPGGLVCAECVDALVPLVLVGPAAGQERANAEALVNAGAALYCADPRMLAEYTRKAISSPARLSAMRTAAERLARPHAARDVAQRVLALVAPSPQQPTTESAQ